MMTLVETSKHRSTLTARKSKWKNICVARWNWMEWNRKFVNIIVFRVERRRELSRINNGEDWAHWRWKESWQFCSDRKWWFFMRVFSCRDIELKTNIQCCCWCCYRSDSDWLSDVEKNLKNTFNSWKWNSNGMEYLRVSRCSRRRKSRIRKEMLQIAFLKQFQECKYFYYPQIYFHFNSCISLVFLKW